MLRTLPMIKESLKGQHEYAAYVNGHVNRQINGQPPALLKKFFHPILRCQHSEKGKRRLDYASSLRFGLEWSVYLPVVFFLAGFAFLWAGIALIGASCRLPTSEASNTLRSRTSRNVSTDSRVPTFSAIRNA